MKIKVPNGRHQLLMLASLLTIGSGSNLVRAADTEAFEPQYIQSRRPNVLFVVDSTYSLGGASSSPKYDSSIDYSTYLKQNERCTSTTAYFDPATAGVPDCTRKGVGKLPVNANFHCDATSLATLQDGGYLEIKVLEKIVSGGRNPTTSYVALSPSYPNNGSAGAYCEGSGAAGAPAANLFMNVSPTRLYYGNYLNFEKALPLLPPVAGPSRMSYVKDSLVYVADKYKDKINVGMMRSSTTGAKQTGGAGKGGMVVFPIKPMDSAAIYSAYHGDVDYTFTQPTTLQDIVADGSNTTFDDFVWTMRDRVACKQDQDCGGTPPPVTNCAPGNPNDCIPVMQPNGSSKPLAEMLYEAYLYFTGQDVQYGTRSAVDPTIDFDSVPESIANPNASTGSKYYAKPSAQDCQNNYIIMITDGLSAQDSSSNTDIKKLVESLPQTILTDGGYQIQNNQVTFPTNSWSSNAKAPSEFIDDLAFYLSRATKSIAPKMPPTGIKTYAVGFQLAGTQDEVDATQLLNDVAKAGGTQQAVFANSPETLALALDDIITMILTSNTSFSAPSVTVNAFNRTQNLNDLYMAVFRPEYLRHWKGNVKKYTVNPVTGDIEDKNGNVAVDPQTGFFKEYSQSLWAPTYDGALAPEGGAAYQIPDPSQRTILVDGSGTTLEALDGYVSSLTAAEKSAAFNIPLNANTDTDTTTLVDWLYGVDTYDEAPVGPADPNTGLFKDGDGNTTDQKRLMGDPLHSRPAVVVYGRNNNKDDSVVYITTNEGLLHAIDSSTGQEKWSFVPQELLYRLEFLRDRGTQSQLKNRTDPRYYGIDGSVRVLRIDRDGDGPIDSSKGDKVLAFFGLRRGGSSYYGFDLTDPDNPKLLWKWSLPDGAQSWSNPTVGGFVRVNVSGVSYGSISGFDNADPENRFVVVIGGGFDPTNDSLGHIADGLGNKIYMLDAISGNVLWKAGPTASGANLKLDNMQDSIVADIRVVDLSGDSFADRMYAADLGGHVWRFDIHNGNNAASLVTGGIMASVGYDTSGIDRRFYYAPDVAEVRCSGRVFYNVAIGSGDRENPISDGSTQNTFFSFRDTLMRTPVDTANYKTDCSLTTDPCFETILDDSRLVDVTTTPNAAIPADKTGWKMDLVAVDASVTPPTTTARGEKVLAEARTFANGVYFTSYAPEPRGGGYCGTYVGINRLYVVSACNAAPINNFDTTTAGANSVSDRSLQLAQGSIAPEVVFIFPTPPPGCTSRSCLPPPQCLVGLASCGRGVANDPVRVFWRERGAE